MASLPKTYKAVIITEANAPFTLSDVELQHPTAGQVLVKVLACGLCYSDVGMARGEKGNVFPRIPGHEIVGDVVEVGPGVDHIAIGERVGGPWHGGHDGTCRACRRSQFQYCQNRSINGLLRDGGLAEYVLLRSEAVVRVPKEIDPAQAGPLLCAGVTVFNGIRKLHVEQGALVAVQGLGGLGHLAVQYANKMGYEVAVLSSGDDKAAFAKQLGAHHYINTSTTDAMAELMKLGGAALIVQTAPNPKVIGSLIGGLAPLGKILNVAAVGPVEFNTTLLVGKGASVHGWASGHALDGEEALRFALKHNIECMVERFPFADIQKAVDSLVEGRPRFRNVLIM